MIIKLQINKTTFKKSNDNSTVDSEDDIKEI